MKWKPNRIVAVLLGLIGKPLGMLYLMRIRWAVFYFLAPLAAITGVIISSMPKITIVAVGSIFSIACAIHAYILSGREVSFDGRPWYSKWYGLVSLTAIYIVVLIAARTFVYDFFAIPSNSMAPTINAGSYIFVKKYGYGNYDISGVEVARSKMSAPLSRGDIIVFRYPVNRSVSFVKRIVGIPGDHVVLKGQDLIVNDHQVSTGVVNEHAILSYARTIENTIKSETLSGITYHVAYINGAEEKAFDVKVPDNSYFVLGDDRDNSRDSRHFGFVTQNDVVGKVIYVSKQ